MQLSTSVEVIEKLGGTKAVAELTGRTYDAAWNWRRFNAFPANTYKAINDALKEKGYTAPASLWRMVEAS